MYTCIQDVALADSKSERLFCARRIVLDTSIARRPAVRARVHVAVLWYEMVHTRAWPLLWRSRFVRGKSACSLLFSIMH